MEKLSDISFHWYLPDLNILVSFGWFKTKDIINTVTGNNNKTTVLLSLHNFQMFLF